MPAFYYLRRNQGGPVSFRSTIREWSPQHASVGRPEVLLEGNAWTGTGDCRTLGSSNGGVPPRTASTTCGLGEQAA